LTQFAPWIRKIWVVTNGQVPKWLDLDHPRLQVVPHSAIYPNKSHLPVFSSPSIECHLHRIEGLAPRFIYFNDDVLLGNKVYPDDWYTKAYGHKIYLAWDTPLCNTGCPDAWLGDGLCDRTCNVESCQFDHGDCVSLLSAA